jgi:hypothetical protein
MGEKESDASGNPLENLEYYRVTLILHDISGNIEDPDGNFDDIPRDISYFGHLNAEQRTKLVMSLIMKKLTENLDPDTFRPRRRMEGDPCGVENCACHYRQQYHIKLELCKRCKGPRLKKYFVENNIPEVFQKAKDYLKYKDENQHHIEEIMKISKEEAASEEILYYGKIEGPGPGGLQGKEIETSMMDWNKRTILDIRTNMKALDGSGNPIDMGKVSDMSLSRMFWYNVVTGTAPSLKGCVLRAAEDGMEAPLQFHLAYKGNGVGKKVIESEL